MLGEIVGLQQISITLAFLSVMIAILFFLRHKGAAIRSSLHSSKRIHVLEETVVAPGERLRLITIDDQNFVMVSAKGVAPSIVPIQQLHPAPAVAGTSPDFAAGRADTQTPDEAYHGQPFDLTEHVGSAAPAETAMASHNHIRRAEQEKAEENDPQMSDFALTFKRWRQER